MLPEGESGPQGTLKGVREQEDGRGECRPVTGRIGIEAKADIIPRESGQTSIWSIFTREQGEPLKEGKQMKVLQDACAPSGRTVDWRQIEWQKVYQNTRRLQARIVKATQEGRWGKVKALQHLLTHSYSGKVLAVRRVTENQGKRTPGVDGVKWSTPEAKSNAVMSLRQRGYRTKPLRRIYIPKSKGGKTPDKYSVHDGQGDAGALSARLAADRGDNGGQSLLRVPNSEEYCGCNGRLFSPAQRNRIRAMDFRRGHQGLFR